ncbi:hypothetical protein J4558_22525 [Leptolyngbya sp. 15MV]|nr:hypothetical protein J4558_22525 [Leptolyngbya sp. 15MV]
MADTDALSRILSQVEAAKPELDAYAPAGFGWHGRAVAAVNTLVPWLVKEAPGLRLYVEEVLNSPALLREAWAALKSQVDAPGEVARIDELLKHEQVLLDFVAGDTVSIVVTGHLLARYPGGILGAMLCLVVLRPRIKGSIPLVGAGLLGLIAAGLGIAGTLLATDRERLRARSVELIDAVARVDAGSMSAIFAPGVRLQTGLSIQQVPRVVGREALVDAVERTLGGPFAVKEHAVLEVQAQLDGRDVARTQVRVRATPSSAMYQVPAFSWWRLDWRRSDQTWELTSIEPLAIWFAGHDLRR